MQQIVEDKLYSLKFAAEVLCVTKQTLRNWDVKGTFIAHRTDGNHRRYFGKAILEKLNNNNKLSDTEVK